MKSLNLHRRSPSLMAAFLIPLLAFILACGPGEQPTPTPAATATATAVPTATPTAVPAASPTPTRPGPAATPTPTSVAPPAPTPTPGEQPKRGGAINLVLGATPENFDSHLLYGCCGETSQHGMLGKIYSNVFINYRGQEIECEICSEGGWRLEDGGKTMILNMKPGIKFHNGQEMTSADVAYTLNMMMGQVDGIVSARVGVIKEYIVKTETPSKYELRIKLVRPSIYVPKVLSVALAVIYRDGTTRESLKKEPAGSGPFKLTKYIPGAGATLDRNPDYFKPGLPYLDRAEVTVAADATTQWAAFFTHKIDSVAIALRPQDQFAETLYKMRDDGKINIKVFNCNGYFGAYMVYSKPPFNDIRVRQAVNLVIDRTNMGYGTFGKEFTRWTAWREQLLGYCPNEEFGTPANQIWDVVPGWGRGAKKLAEIEQAKKLMADAGFPQGMDIKQFSSTASNIGYAAGSEIMQQELAKIGIRTTLDIAKPGEFAARLANLDYLIQHYIFFILTKDPDEAIGQYWITGGSRNPVGYSNPTVDKLFVQMSGETDPAKRKAIFFQIQDIVSHDYVYAPSPNHDSEAYWWKNLGGYELGFGFGANGYLRGDRLWLRQ